MEIKRSRFITCFGTIGSKQAARTFIASVKIQYPDANHHCWAAISGVPDDVRQHDQSDDGEPKGTAGKPMLNVLQHSGLGNIVVVVTRYFGGIKLGAGGLVRAYTRAVSEPLKTLQTQTVRLSLPLTIELPYASLDAFEHWLQSQHTEIVGKFFTQSVRLDLSVPASEQAALIEKTRNLTGVVVKSINGSSSAD